MGTAPQFQRPVPSVAVPQVESEAVALELAHYGAAAACRDLNEIENY